MRLLKEAEMVQALMEYGKEGNGKAIAKAQHQLDLREFIEWLDSECLEHDMDGRDIMRMRFECDECKQSLKQLVEVK